MKTPFLHLLLPAVLALLLPAGCGPAERAAAESHALEIRLLPGERWWTGVIADAHHFPLDSSSAYRFDFWGNTAGNQGQPLLLSNRGRYVWNEEPFRFEFSGGTLRCHSDRADFSSGTAGETLREAYLHCSRSFFPPSGAMPAEELFRAPQFNTWIEFTYHQNQRGILDYARGIVGHGFEPGVLMIDEGWFIDYGNWEFDALRFPNPEAMMAQLKDLGFSVMLWVCPYYSPDGLFWKEQWLRTTREGDTIWVVNAEDPSMPAVMRWWDGQSNVIDLSRPNGRDWFRAQLDRLMADYGVAGFKFDGGDAEHYSERGFLTETRSYRPDIHANEHSRLFAELGLAYPMNEYRAAWKMGGQALAMRLRDKNHDWADLRKLIPGSICQGLMGYPYTCPDLIGGGEYLSFRNQDSIDQELVVRAAQCHALMPMMQFSVAPWRVLSPENLAICVRMAELHTGMSGYILELARASARSGEPIVRPLDYQYPGRGYENIDDQYLLGSDLLVAPVVEKAARSRRVVFPEGEWKDASGEIFRGPQTAEIEAPLEVLPWFERVK